MLNNFQKFSICVVLSLATIGMLGALYKFAGLTEVDAAALQKFLEQVNATIKAGVNYVVLGLVAFGLTCVWYLVLFEPEFWAMPRKSGSDESNKEKIP